MHNGYKQLNTSSGAARHLFHLAQSSRCSLRPACRRAGAGERRSFRQPPPPRFIPPSGSIVALFRFRSHCSFRQPPPPLPFPPLAGSVLRSHWQRFGFEALKGKAQTIISSLGLCMHQGYTSCCTRSSVPAFLGKQWAGLTCFLYACTHWVKLCFEII